MAQATMGGVGSAPAAASGAVAREGEVWEGELFRALSTLITRLRRTTGDAETGARTFLLGHLDRLGPVRMSDLAGHACLDQSTVSRHLRSLEEQGLVTRSPDPADGRATLLDLSPAGRDVLDRAVRARTQLITGATAGWPENDRAALAHLMTRLADDLETTP